MVHRSQEVAADRSPADIAPAILRLHPELDSRQREVVAHGDGPLLVIAGPGSGKTRSIQLRAVNLLITGQVSPEELVLCTFGRDATLELGQRFTASLRACGHPGDPGEVQISTIHSLCHRLLAPRPGEVGLRPDYRVLDEGEQQKLLLQELDRIVGPDWAILSRHGWRDRAWAAAEAARYFDRICDELLDPGDLTGSDSAFIAALGRCLQRYRELLRDRNLVDFAHLQVWADDVIGGVYATCPPEWNVRHLMVDEFQDTSWIQMRILGRLVEAHGNIVAVGDDDQSIYRFRGACVANLLNFPSQFPVCRRVELTTNYRSHRDIVAAVGRWMGTAAAWEVGGRSYRYEKDIVAADTWEDYPAVIAVQGDGVQDEVRRLGELLRFLRGHGVIGSYGQAALLLHSVKDRVSGPYLDGLEVMGVPARCEPAGHIRGDADEGLLVTTIHQAKGREWDVVVVGSLTGSALDTDRIGRNLADCGVYSGEPEGGIGEFDRARRQYVAFTRARHLLVLTASGPPRGRFRSLWNTASRWPDVDRHALAKQRFGDPAAVPPPVVEEIGYLEQLTIRLPLA